MTKPQTKRIWKGMQTFIHDLFKAKVCKMKRNVSFVWGDPRIVDTEHTHFFHTFNSQGKPQKYTNTVGEHFHEIEWGEDDEGNLVARCGPPLRYGTHKMPNGRKVRRIEKVSWKDMSENSFNTEGVIRDDHVHEMQYIRSEELSLAKKGTNPLAQQIIDERRRLESGVYNGPDFEMRPTI